MHWLVPGTFFFFFGIRVIFVSRTMHEWAYIHTHMGNCTNTFQVGVKVPEAL